MFLLPRDSLKLISNVLRLLVLFVYHFRRHNLLALHNLRLTLVLASILVGICEVAQYSVIIHQLGQLNSNHPGGASSDHTPEDVRLETKWATDSGPGDQDDDDAGLPMVTAVMGLCSSCFEIVSILVGAVFVRAVEVKDECGKLVFDCLVRPIVDNISVVKTLFIDSLMIYCFL